MRKVKWKTRNEKAIPKRRPPKGAEGARPPKGAEGARPTAREALRAGVLKSKRQKKHEAIKHGSWEQGSFRVRSCLHAPHFNIELSGPRS